VKNAAGEGEAPAATHLHLDLTVIASLVFEIYLTSQVDDQLVVMHRENKRSVVSNKL